MNKKQAAGLAFLVGVQMSIQEIKDILQLVISVISICVSMFALYKFLSKPHNSLEARVSHLEKDVSDIKTSLREGNDKFRDQAKLNSVFKAVNLAFIDFEIAYCLNTGYKDISDLKKAKRILQNSLAGYEDMTTDEEED